MLAEKDFRNKVWEKYDNYMLGNNNNSFFQQDIYKNDNIIKKVKFYEIVRAIATFILTAIMGAGVVYAATTIYEKIWKEPEVIEYQEEQKVTEEDKEILITEEEAKNKAIEFLNKIQKEDTITNAEYIKYPAVNKIYWKISFNEGYVIEVNAKNAKIVSYFDSTVNDIEIKATANKKEATQVSEKIYNLISQDKDYVLKDADYCKKYDDIFNDYQCIRLTFVPETEQIKIINIFDEEFENNPIVITKEEAEQIVKEKLSNETISSIDTKLKIEKMNEYVYMQDNKLKENQAYKMDVTVRKVWSVEFILKKNNFEQSSKVYVDVTTGEIIGGDILQ